MNTVIQGKPSFQELLKFVRAAVMDLYTMVGLGFNLAPEINANQAQNCGNKPPHFRLFSAKDNEF